MNTENSGITSNMRRAMREIQRQRPLTLVEGIWKNVMNDLIWVLKDWEITVGTLQVERGTGWIERIYYCSVTHLCLTLCDPVDCSTPGFPILHCLLEFAQTHAHWVGDAIQPSRPHIYAFFLDTKRHRNKYITVYLRSIQPHCGIQEYKESSV